MECTVHFLFLIVKDLLNHKLNDLHLTECSLIIVFVTVKDPINYNKKTLQRKIVNNQLMIKDPLNPQQHKQQQVFNKNTNMKTPINIIKCLQSL